MYTKIKRYCYRCGNELADNASRCPKCGFDMKTVEKLHSSKNQSRHRETAGFDYSSLIRAIVSTLLLCIVIYGAYQFRVISEQSSPDTSSETEQQTTTPDKTKAADEESAKESGQSDAISDVIPHYKDRFYLKNLDKELQNNATAIYKGICNFETSIKLPQSMTEKETELILNVIQFDCPELFQVDFSKQYTMTLAYERVNAVSLPYCMTEEDYKRHLQECKDVIHRLQLDNTSRSSADREKYVYDYLTSVVSYSTTGVHCGNAYGALIEKKAKCDGISLAMKWVMEEMGIPTIVISGKDNSDPYGHAWNCLYYSGHYYDVDLTNDLKTNDSSMKLYGAYNVPRSWLSAEYPIADFIRNNFDIPTINTMNYSYHAEHGSLIYAGENIIDSVNEKFDQAVDWNDGTGLLQFESIADFEFFMKNYDSIVEDWFYTNEYGGSFSLHSLEEFSTVGFELELDY